MPTVIAKLKVRAGTEADFVRAGREMIAHVKAQEPGTLTYLFHRAQHDPTTFVFVERYTDRQALDAHAQSEQMMKFMGAIGQLLDGPPLIEMFEEIDGKR